MGKIIKAVIKKLPSQQIKAEKINRNKRNAAATQSRVEKGKHW